MKNGNAPFSVKGLAYEGRERFELHHIKHLEHGGGVYDMDNIIPLPPRVHAAIHSLTTKERLQELLAKGYKWWW